MQNQTTLRDDVLYNAYLGRDSRYQGVFYMGVKTTGIFCRPGCTAKTPKRENVEFFSTTAEAQQKGYRPCKKCQPLNQPGDIPEWVQQAIALLEQQPFNRVSDTQLQQKKIDPVRLRRWFKHHQGVTFQAYQRMLRIGRAYGQIKQGQKVINSAFDSGYSSLSGFNEAFKKITGFVPSGSRQQRLIKITRVATPLGTMLAAGDDEGLCLLEFSDRKALQNQLQRVQKMMNAIFVAGQHPLFKALQTQLDEYFDGKRKQFSIKLVLNGSDFQRAAWSALLQIPYAETRSYQQQAKILKRPAAVRAVGTANGANAIAILVPCHRVIASDGSLSGYGGDVWRKRFLLDLEKKHL